MTRGAQSTPAGPGLGFSGPDGKPVQFQIQSALTKLLEGNTLDPRQRAYALCARAAADNYHPKHRADLEEAVQLAPYGLTGVFVHNSLARLLRSGQTSAAAVASHRASELLEAERLVAKAQETLERWDSKDEDLRVAFDLLLRAGRATSFSRWQLALLMANLKHRLHEDTAATSWAIKALDLAPDSHKARIRRELTVYSSEADQFVWTTPPRTSREDAHPILPESASGSVTGVRSPSRLSVGCIHNGEN